MSSRAIGKTKRIVGAGLDEVRALRTLRPQVGTRRAVAARIRGQLELGGVDARRIEDLGGAAHESRIAQAALADRLEAAQSRLRRLEDHDVAGRVAQLELSGAEDRIARRALAMEAFVAQLEPSPTTISVVLTTRNRPALLERALASVGAQGHEARELIVAADPGDADTAAVLDRFGDPRLVRVDRAGLNRGAALNRALEAATGDVVAYLDDDNVMLPGYLRALAWAFDEHPDQEVAYAILVRQRDGDTIPSLEFHPWNERLLAHGNLVDHNAVAHRRGLAEERFAEDLGAGLDWERLERLTSGRPPLALPFTAAVYRSDAPERISDASDRIESYREVKRRIARRRPLRVLASNQMFPLITETYVNDELEALVDRGAQLAYYRDDITPSPMRVPRTVYTDWDRALQEFAPDVVMLYWATYAETQIARLEACGLPFGVRVHSFDHDAERVARLRDHPQCIGVWSYPSEAFRMEGGFDLPPLFTSVRDLPEPAETRDAVVSISAGLPKKDWPVLFDAMGQLHGVDRRVVVGVTSGWTQVPGELADRAVAMADPPLVQVNLARAETHALLARTALLVYTLHPKVRFGMPMSVAEALCAGCSVVLPDRPECREYAGPHFRGYRTPDDIARHAREVLAGGPAIEAERRANAEYGRARFCAPELGDRFHAELRESVAAYGAPRERTVEASLNGSADAARTAG